MVDTTSQTTALTCTTGSCSLDDGSCGTGEWGGWDGSSIPPVVRPQPGEANNTTYLVAVPTFGGVTVRWALPTVNPYGVAYVLVYRNTTPNWDTAMNLGSAGSGNTYFDVIDNKEDVSLYYWIRIVTSAGNTLPQVGPAKAEKRAFIGDLIEHLTGQIDSSVLAQKLKEEIVNITLNKKDLDSEIAKRIASNEVLSLAFARVQAGLDESIALMHTETVQRTEGMNAMMGLYTTMAAVNKDQSAAILQNKETIVTATSALSTQTTQWIAASAADTKAIIDETRTSLTTADQAIGRRIDSVQASFGDQLAGVEQNMEADIRLVNGKMTAIGALWTAKTTVNGLVGGFGVYNDGRTVDAGFDVDTFWVGRTNSDKRKPFIISGGVTYIDDALIRKLTFDKLISSDGTLLFEAGVLKARHIIVDTISIRNSAVSSIDSVNWNPSGLRGHNASESSNTAYVNCYDGTTNVVVNFTMSGNIAGNNLSSGDTYISYTNLHNINVEIKRNGSVIHSKNIAAWNGFDDNTGAAQGTYVPMAITIKDVPGGGNHGYSATMRVTNAVGYPLKFSGAYGNITATAYKR